MSRYREEEEEGEEEGRGAESAGELDEAMRDLPEDVSADELQEFLAADALEVEADPFFRERLRRKLWAIVRERFGDEEDPAGGTGSGKDEPGFGSGAARPPASAARPDRRDD